MLFKFLCIVIIHCTKYLLSVFSLAKSLQLILEISAIYWIVSYLLAADNWLICRLCAQLHDSQKQYQLRFLATVCLLSFSSKQVFKCYQRQPSARLITLLPRPRFFRIFQKPHPIFIVYCRLLQRSVRMWSRGEEHVRVLAFLGIRNVATMMPSSLLEFSVKVCS